LKAFFNRTRISSLICIALALFIFWDGTHISRTLVNNEPGPTFFPYVAAGGLIIFSVLSAIFDGKKDNDEPYLSKEGKKRLAIILVEIVAFILGMTLFGFLPTALVMLAVIIMTLNDGKKMHMVAYVAVVVGVSCAVYFGFKYGLGVPFPKGIIWESLMS